MKTERGREREREMEREREGGREMEREWVRERERERGRERERFAVLTVAHDVIWSIRIIGTSRRACCETWEVQGLWERLWPVMFPLDPPGLSHILMTDRHNMGRGVLRTLTTTKFSYYLASCSCFMYHWAAFVIKFLSGWYNIIMIVLCFTEWCMSSMFFIYSWSWSQ